MVKAAYNAMPDRPNRPLVIKCGYEGSTRRVTFPSSATCRLQSLRTRVEECFSLSASPFFLIYTDDDGEDFPIRSESDLTEAILFFVSGDDDAPSGSSPHRKVTLRLDVVVEYDGPSLSDTSSIRSVSTGDERSESSWRSSGYEESYRSYGSNGLQDEAIEEEEEERRTEYAAVNGGPLLSGLGEMSLGLRCSLASGRFRDPDRMREDSSDNFTVSGPHLSAPISSRPLPQPPPLTGSDRDPAPILLTNSELGSRWLHEQSRLATRRRGPGTTPSRNDRRYDSDDESLGSDEETRGDFALVRDGRGKYYYSYQDTETSSLSSRSEANLSPPGSQSLDPSVRKPSPSPRPIAITPVLGTPVTTKSDQVAGPGPLEAPILAPDCSACGSRLDYMRYVCLTCGEGDMWNGDVKDKPAFVGPRHSSDGDMNDASSDRTEWAAQAGTSGSHTILDIARSRYGSSSTHASRGSVGGVADGAFSDTQAVYDSDQGLTPPDSPSSQAGRLSRSARNRGYELCPSCIEEHGIVHSNMARRRRVGSLRHAFREMIWGVEGWTDVGVSCQKFDLCRSCYQKVDEIHPAHTFLSLPDQLLPHAGPSRSNGADRGNGDRQIGSVPKPMRHPGAFCHNCLQDIVGPRFHCAVCTSWDLCIQCEGIASAADASGHTAEHIMMKIPIPLASAEVEDVSRRARDRWFQQDLSTVAAAGANLSRSSSPTNETVYAGDTERSNGGTQVALARPITSVGRDALDHQCRCSNCNEWIMGRRFQCANCPSGPEASNLCSICELRSYRVHDPRHVFFKFDRPVQFPLDSHRPLLPLLYKSRVGEVPVGATVHPRDPTAYLKHVVHRETLCDIHADQIRGAWLRCVHCAGGFDICQEAEEVANHDPLHFFVVFKARVNMVAFRALAQLDETHSKPLLTEQVYLE